LRSASERPPALVSNGSREPPEGQPIRRTPSEIGMGRHRAAWIRISKAGRLDNGVPECAYGLFVERSDWMQLLAELAQDADWKSSSWPLSANGGGEGALHHRHSLRGDSIRNHGRDVAPWRPTNTTMSPMSGIRPSLFHSSAIRLRMSCRSRCHNSSPLPSGR
jgi:hypothetical protein